MPKKKNSLPKSTSHDIHGLLDYMLVEAVVSNQDMAKRFRVPYKNVVPAEKLKYPESELIVEIAIYWDGVKHVLEPAPTASPNKTRH